MAWTQSARKSRLPRDWDSIREQVLRRAGYRCEARDSIGQRCRERANQCDHIVPGDNHSLENLQALCRWHHARKSSAEGAASRRPRARQAREPEPHPAFLAASGARPSAPPF